MNAGSRRIAYAIASFSVGLSAIAQAKPIGVGNGATRMGQYGAATMAAVQAFYAPSFRYSIGGGHLVLDSDISDASRDITYARFNYPPKRWNLEDAQANVFIWGSAGNA